MKAALEEGEDGLTDEVLAVLPPGQRRKVKAAATQASSVPNSLAATDRDGDAGTERSRRPARAAKVVRSYFEDDAADSPHVKGKKTKRSDL